MIQARRRWVAGEPPSGPSSLRIHFLLRLRPWEEVKDRQTQLTGGVVLVFTVLVVITAALAVVMGSL